MHEREENKYNKNCCGCKKRKKCFARLRCFWKYITVNSYRLTDILSLFVDEVFLKETFTFWIEILWGDKIIFLKDETGAGTEKFRVEQKCDQKNEEVVIWKRCIGILTCGKKVNYCIEISRKNIDDNCIDLTFLHCAEKVYYEWIVEQLSAIMHAEQVNCDLDTRIDLSEFSQNISIEFSGYMRRIYSIPIDVITAISGIYYESESCCSNLSFCLSDIEESKIPHIKLKKLIPFDTSSIKQIRKQLQMGNAEQCLLLRWKDEKWSVVGLYKANDLLGKGINFAILKHMVWTMFVGERLSVCFDSCAYKLMHKKFARKTLEEKYKAIFEQEAPEKMKTVFEEVFEQKHGTILIIMKGCEIEAEVERLMEKSTGMLIEPMDLSDGFVKSVTSIDGALIVNNQGKCYGYGMILDDPSGGEAEFTADPARGARYNSAQRYIAGCKKKERSAIGVVVSEDGPVTIISTDDA